MEHRGATVELGVPARFLHNLERLELRVVRSARGGEGDIPRRQPADDHHAHPLAPDDSRLVIREPVALALRELPIHIRIARRHAVCHHRNRRALLPGVPRLVLPEVENRRVLRIRHPRQFQRHIPLRERHIVREGREHTRIRGLGIPPQGNRRITVRSLVRQLEGRPAQHRARAVLHRRDRAPALARRRPGERIPPLPLDRVAIQTVSHILRERLHPNRRTLVRHLAHHETEGVPCTVQRLVRLLLQLHERDCAEERSPTRPRPLVVHLRDPEGVVAVGVRHLVREHHYAVALLVAPVCRRLTPKTDEARAVGIHFVVNNRQLAVLVGVLRLIRLTRPRGRRPVRKRLGHRNVVMPICRLRALTNVEHHRELLIRHTREDKGVLIVLVVLAEERHLARPRREQTVIARYNLVLRRRGIVNRSGRHFAVGIDREARAVNGCARVIDDRRVREGTALRRRRRLQVIPTPPVRLVGSNAVERRTRECHALTVARAEGEVNALACELHARHAHVRRNRRIRIHAGDNLHCRHTPASTHRVALKRINLERRAGEVLNAHHVRADRERCARLAVAPNVNIVPTVFIVLTDRGVRLPRNGVVTPRSIAIQINISVFTPRGAVRNHVEVHIVLLVGDARELQLHRLLIPRPRSPIAPFSAIIRDVCQKRMLVGSCRGPRRIGANRQRDAIFAVAVGERNCGVDL